MRDLPAGTVTFLFTDVEGSTKLLHELGAAEYAEALAEHRRILREGFGSHGGVEVRSRGVRASARRDPVCPEPQRRTVAESR